MYPLSILWNVNPDAFVLGPFHVRYYGLMFIAAFLSGTFIFWYILKREGLSQSLLVRLLNIVFLSTLIGARLGECLFYYPDYYLKHPLEILFPFVDGKFQGFQGLSSHGAAIGLLLGLFLFSRTAKLSYIWLLDRMAIVAALGGVFVRIGNLFNSEICGTPTNLPWGFVFMQNGETIPRHPTQIYEALAYLAVFIVLGYIYLKKQAKPPQGLLLGIFLLLIFTLRFLIEYVKAPQIPNEIQHTLHIGQWLSLPFIFAGACLLMSVVMRGELKNSSKI